jgi:very-short-patch-repair endonuclease
MRGEDTRTTDRARQLRREATIVEKRLWWRLSARQLDRHKFVRQLAIGPYFADFACREHRLVIELDGGQHAGSQTDPVRTAYLEAQGYRVIRFWNSEVIENIDGVLEQILQALAS